MQRWHPIPPAVYSLVEQTPGALLLESSLLARQRALSRLFLSPIRVLTAYTPAELDDLLVQIDEAERQDLFAAGYFAYECGAWAEPTAGLRQPAPGRPIAWLGIHAQCHLFDHRTGRFFGKPPEALANCATPESAEPVGLRPAAGLEEGSYAERIAAIHEAIRAGDVYQLNFTFPLHFESEESPAALYSRLRRSQPAQYAAFMNVCDGRHLLSFSPELFFRIEPGPLGRRIVVQPMKGTASRGRTTAEDRARADWLRNDPKNRAENVMIVDLLRNDLGRLCTFGSVKVPHLFSVERHETLWQMTSSVTGQLREEARCADVLRALFPSGSVTGAPKVRAMQLLAGHEDAPRGIYTGAIGYYARNEAVFNVAIRTIELDRGRGQMNVGSGIVIDSNAHDEYRECLLKGQFLTRLQPEFDLVETLRWEGGYPLLKMHLDRLCDSAEYFGFVCDRNAVKSTLLELAEAFPGEIPRKVRLLLSRGGTVQTAHEELSDTAGGEPVRLLVAAERTDARDRFLFHKTTYRPAYAAGLDAARAAGCDDALFLNADGEVTETATANVFIERGGKWFTPPAECGLLAGVYRRWLLSRRNDIEERRLRLEDVQAADGVWVSNAVRGLRRAVVIGE